MNRQLAWTTACLMLLSCASTPDVPENVGASVDWTHPGGGPDESSFSRLTRIHRGNVDELGLAWSMDLDAEATLEAPPLAVGGVLYFTGSYAAVYAVDAISGELLWRFDPETWKHNPMRMNFAMSVNRGVAYAEGRIFSGAVDGRLFALDAKSGEVLWSVETVPPGWMNSVTGAPRTFNDKVIIGNGGADMGARGYVTAYDQATGELAWRFFTVPGAPAENAGNPAMERAAATWNGEYWKTGTGGTVWNGITFDPELNLVYIGTGNGGPYDPSVRSPGGGDNLYLASIVALDGDTGEYVWHYQMNPGEAWDYKCTANMITADLTLDGELRKVIMQAPTNGFFYVLDRETGELLSAEKIGKVTWAERIDLETGRPVEAPNIRYEHGEVKLWPGPLGAHNFQPMSYSPLTGLVYIPTMQLGVRMVKREALPGEFSVMGLIVHHHVEDENDNTGAVLAWDPVRQEARWRVPLDTLWNGGMLSTAGGLVFHGAADGTFSAYDDSSGERLWSFYAGQGILAPPTSYEVDGEQYVSVLAGYGGTAPAFGPYLDEGWRYRVHKRRLLTFRLGGEAALETHPPDKTVHAVDDPAVEIDEADIIPGKMLYTMQCGTCHGMELSATGTPAPDLRESALTIREESLWAVLHDPTLIARGMPRRDHLSREQVRQIHAYIRAGAREALGTREPAAGDAGIGAPLR